MHGATIKTYLNIRRKITSFETSVRWYIRGVTRLQRQSRTHDAPPVHCIIPQGYHCVYRSEK